MPRWCRRTARSSGVGAELFVRNRNGVPLAFSADLSTANRDPLFALLVEYAHDEARLGVVYDPTAADELSQSLVRLFLRAETPGHAALTRNFHAARDRAPWKASAAKRRICRDAGR